MSTYTVLLTDGTVGIASQMTYEQFKAEYTRLFFLMMKYNPDQAGSRIYASELATLADAYPDYEHQLDNEDEF